MIIVQFIGRFVFDMNGYKKSPVDEKKLGINPFLALLKIRVYKNKSDDKFKYDTKEDIWGRADVEFETESYCKVFSDAGKRLNMVGLSPRAKDLLLWLIYEAENGKDYLWLNKKRYMEECNIGSINTYRSALNELIGVAFIIRTNHTDYFWINPGLFFNGNRIRKFPDNLVVK